MLHVCLVQEEQARTAAFEKAMDQARLNDLDTAETDDMHSSDSSGMPCISL